MPYPLLRPVLCCVCLFAASAKGGDIAEGLKEGSFWGTPLSENKNFSDVRYSCPQEQTLRTSGSRGLKIAALKVGETLVSVDEEQVPVAMTVMVYNKGDNGDVSKSEFNEYVTAVTEALNEMTGVKGRPRKVNKKDSGVQISAVQWVWDNGAARLESSFTQEDKATFQPEFVRVKLGKNADALERGGASDAVAKNKLRGRVTKTAKGCVIEGIPMVDQGQKGYCVPATLSRLFAYYGMDGVDQHALAALCKSDGDGGTSMLGMEAALNDISRAFHIRMQKVSNKPLLKDYNKFAKRSEARQLSQQMLEWGYPFDDAVAQEMMESKSAPAMLKKWVTPIAKSIDMGIPVVWSVMLGLYPEQGLPQVGGGHMRMIIGYDWESNEIIYSDSWGAGHEVKRMPMKQAFVITQARYILRPSR